MAGPSPNRAGGGRVPASGRGVDGRVVCGDAHPPAAVIACYCRGRADTCPCRYGESLSSPYPSHRLEADVVDHVGGFNARRCAGRVKRPKPMRRLATIRIWSVAGMRLGFQLQATPPADHVTASVEGHQLAFWCCSPGCRKLTLPSASVFGTAIELMTGCPRIADTWPLSGF